MFWAEVEGWPVEKRARLLQWCTGSTRVPVGGCLCFFHGEHPLSLLHEGRPLTRGVKTILRTDVLYATPTPGTRWRIHGLQRRADLNGRVAKVLAPAEAAAPAAPAPAAQPPPQQQPQRIPVVVCDAAGTERITILPRNLRPLVS